MVSAGGARRRLSILGSTGSVGRSTVDVIESLGGAETFDVEALVAGRNVELLAEQARRLRARVAVVADPQGYAPLQQALAGAGVEAAAGAAAATEAAGLAVDWVMAAIVGAAGIAPTLAAARSGATIALANKETLVSAAEPFLAAMAEGGGALLPVDSEHSAIFQVLDQRAPEAVERIILTASGGPFREWSAERIAAARPEDALRHPNWSMGAKISVDSATMMNKGLEVIEAARLFPVAAERIEVLVHPQSVIHSMVAYVDGSVLAQLGAPDMRTPIAYALGWPARVPAPVERLDLARLGRLDFEPPDPERFPALRLAREALEAGGAAPAVLNAANEAAVSAFLGRRIGFSDIVRLVERVLARATPETAADLESVLAADAAARRLAEAEIDEMR